MTEVAQRRAKAVAMRRDGATWQAVVDALGYSDRASAHKDVTRALDIARKELAFEVDQYRQMELERLDKLERTACAVLESKHLLVQGGKVVCIPRGDGEGVEIDPLMDDGPTLAAIDRLLKIAERRSKLLGLDQAQKLEVSGQVLYAVEGVNVEKLM